MILVNDMKLNFNLTLSLIKQIQLFCEADTFFLYDKVRGLAYVYVAVI